MDINASITLLFSHDGLHIELRDEDASVLFADITLNRKQTCQALSRLGCTECAIAKVFNLDKLGKKMKHDTITFALPKSAEDKYGKERDALAKAEAKKHLPEGWESDNYFGSQGSYFTKGGVEMARVTIRKWE